MHKITSFWLVLSCRSGSKRLKVKFLLLGREAQSALKSDTIRPHTPLLSAEIINTAARIKMAKSTSSWCVIAAKLAAIAAIIAAAIAATIAAFGRNSSYNSSSHNHNNTQQHTHNPPLTPTKPTSFWRGALGGWGAGAEGGHRPRGRQIQHSTSDI